MKKLNLLLILFFTHSLRATPTVEQPDRNTQFYNIENNIGLKGYDPVSFFAEFGGQAQLGEASIQGEYGSVIYYFSSEENRKTFFENPTKFEPTYGGWCAWAMANESYADINPVLYTENGNRMHFFINQGAKAQFDKNLSKRETDADIYWKSESGEAPRL